MPKPADDDSARAFFRRIGGALSRILGLAILILSHWGLNKLLEFTTPKAFETELLLLEGVFVAMFALVYCLPAVGDFSRIHSQAKSPGLPWDRGI